MVSLVALSEVKRRFYP